MPDLFSNDLEARLNRELAQLASKIPNVVCLDLESLDGLSIAIYLKASARFNEDAIGAMSHAYAGFNTRISTELALGKWDYFVHGGTDGMALYLALPDHDDLVLIVVVEAGVAIDTVRTAIQSNWQPLLSLLRD